MHIIMHIMMHIMPYYYGVQLVVINDMKTNYLAVAVLAQGPARLLLPVLRRGEYQPHP